MYRFFLFSLILLLPGLLQAQKKWAFGFGTNLGYKSANASSGFLLAADYNDRFHIDAGTAKSKYEGLGWGANFQFYPVKEQVSPVLGIGYSALSAKDVTFDRHTFRVSANQFMVFSAGLKAKFYDHTNPHIVLLAQFHYRYSAGKDSEAEFIRSRTDYLSESYDRKMDAMNRTIADGYGASLAIIIYFGKLSTNQ